MPGFKIESDFAPGDGLYYVMTDAENGPGPVLAQITYNEHGIRAVHVGADRDVRIVHELSDEPELPGGRDTCLSYGDALRYVRENLPGCVHLDGRAVKAIYVSGNGPSRAIDLVAGLDAIEELVHGRIATSEPDGAGTVAIYDGSADKSNAGFMTFVKDAAGNPVDTIYGPFILIGTRLDAETGLLVPADVPENVQHAASLPKDPPPQFDPSYWAKASRMTVRMLMEYLQELPGDAVLHCCGTEFAYLHYAPATKAFSIDCESLDDLPEYEGRGPAVLAGPEG